MESKSNIQLSEETIKRLEKMANQSGLTIDEIINESINQQDKISKSNHISTNGSGAFGFDLLPNEILFNTKEED